jgi:hypothetical protein
VHRCGAWIWVWLALRRWHDAVAGVLAMMNAQIAKPFVIRPVDPERPSLQVYLEMTRLNPYLTPARCVERVLSLEKFEYVEE